MIRVFSHSLDEGPSGLLDFTARRAAGDRHLILGNFNALHVDWRSGYFVLAAERCLHGLLEVVCKYAL